MTTRTGAEILVAASVRAGVDVCFANPGTTEMAIVAALGAVPGIRAVPVLFEGVASGAADGYARIAGRPAATLLHLGPGLGNATANLHDARRAEAPVVNWVGDHATWLLAHDPPLASDIEAIARGTSAWVRTVGCVDDVAREAEAAVRAAAGPPGAVATLVLPDDVQKATAEPDDPRPAPAPGVLDPAAVVAAVDRLRLARAPLVLLGGPAVDARGLRAGMRVAAASGARLLVEQFPRNLRAEPGLPHPSRLQYLPQMARPQLAEHDLVLLVGADPPVCFFGYPGETALLTAEQTAVVSLATNTSDPRAALEALADQLGAAAPPAPEPAPRATIPDGALGADTIAAAIAALLPADGIVVDEGITNSLALYPALAGAAPHDYLACKGGAIGWALPASTGAALAGRGRRVVALVGDGSAAYTLQALWTQAREQLDVTTIVAVNHRYAILQLELTRAGGLVEGPGATLTALDAPTVAWSQLARGFGVPSRRVTDAAECVAALRASFATPGPMLIEALLP